MRKASSDAACGPGHCSAACDGLASESPYAGGGARTRRRFVGSWLRSHPRLRDSSAYEVQQPSTLPDVPAPEAQIRDADATSGPSTSTGVVMKPTAHLTRCTPRPRDRSRGDARADRRPSAMLPIRSLRRALLAPTAAASAPSRRCSARSVEKAAQGAVPLIQYVQRTRDDPPARPDRNARRGSTSAAPSRTASPDRWRGRRRGRAAE